MQRSSQRYLHASTSQQNADIQGSRFNQLSLDDYALPQELLAKLHTPALVIYLDKVRHNIEATLDLCGGDPNRWRPHVKTTKSTRLFKECVDYGVTNFKCATPREAQLLGKTLKDSLGHGDVLVAYPMIGPNMTKLGEIAKEIAPVKLSVLVEESETIHEIPANLGIFIDVNAGMDRSGMPLELAEQGRLLEVAQAVEATEKGRFRGIHMYNGHARVFADGVERETQLGLLYDRLVLLQTNLSSNGINVGEVITSGSIGIGCAMNHLGLSQLSSTSEGGCVHRASPGTVVLHDLNSELVCSELEELVPAAVVVTRVVSHPNPAAGVFTVDTGSKSIACEAGDPVAFVIGHGDFIPKAPSEEHLPISGPPNATKRGDVLYLVPRHVCPTVNLAEDALLVSGDSYNNYEVMPIDARSHDLLM